MHCLSDCLVKIHKLHTVVTVRVSCSNIYPWIFKIWVMDPWTSEFSK